MGISVARALNGGSADGAWEIVVAAISMGQLGAYAWRNVLRSATAGAHGLRRNLVQVGAPSKVAVALAVGRIGKDGIVHSAPPHARGSEVVRGRLCAPSKDLLGLPITPTFTVARPLHLLGRLWRMGREA